MAEYKVGEQFIVTDCECNSYNKHRATILHVEGEDGFWNDRNDKIYKCTLSGFKGFLWFSANELTPLEQYESMQTALGRWLS